MQANIGNLSRTLTLGFYRAVSAEQANYPRLPGLLAQGRLQTLQRATRFSSGGGNLPASQQALVQNYNQDSTGTTISVQYPLRTFLQAQSALPTVFDDASVKDLQFCLAEPVPDALPSAAASQGQKCARGAFTPVRFHSATNTTRSANPYRPRDGESLSLALELAGLGGNVRFYRPVMVYKHFNAMKGLRPNREGRNVLAERFQLSYVQGFNGEVAPPFNRFFQGGEADLRGFDIRGATPYAFIPTNVPFQLTNPDGDPVPRDPTNAGLGNITVPIPVVRHRLGRRRYELYQQS